MMALILASGIDPQKSVIFHQDEVIAFASRCLSRFLISCQIGPEPCRASLDFELSDTDWEAETDDDVEGTWLLHPSRTVTETCMRLQTRLAASRNANDESEVDDSLLNAGLFTYPILQAADILAYRRVTTRFSS
jgi:tryptophanyl-tRNA synthetase